MRRYRAAPGDGERHWRLGVCLTCGVGLALGVAAVLTASLTAWLSGGLGLAGLILLGVGGGLAVAHLVLDQPSDRSVGQR